MKKNSKMNPRESFSDEMVSGVGGVVTEDLDVGPTDEATDVVRTGEATGVAPTGEATDVAPGEVTEIIVQAGEEERRRITGRRRVKARGASAD